MHYCGDRLGPSRWNSFLHLVAGAGIQLNYHYNSSSKKSKTFPDYRYAGRSNQCLNERPDPEHIKDYTLLLSRPLLFKPMRHIANSSKNCLVIHLLKDYFPVEPRRNKMSWCGEVSSLPRRGFYNFGELVFRPSPEEIRAPLKSPAWEARKLGKVIR